MKLTKILGFLGLLASMMPFTGNAECPQTGSGIPIPYYTLPLLNSLINLKMDHLN